MGMASGTLRGTAAKIHEERLEGPAFATFGSMTSRWRSVTSSSRSDFPS